MTLDEIIALVTQEQASQAIKWGSDRPQSLGGFLLIMQAELEEAIQGYVKDRNDKHSALNEIMQVVTVGINCLQRYGLNNPMTTNDAKM
jgi:hypothetical protein